MLVPRAARPAAAVVLALAALLGPAGLSGCSRLCASYEYPLAEGIAASATPAGSLASFLASDDGRGFPRDGWAPSDELVFRSGSAAVTVWELPDGGYAVVSARTC